MTLAELLADLELLGCRLRMPTAGQPELVPPAEMTDAVRDQIMNLAIECRALRQEIVEYLADSCPICERPIMCDEDRDRLADPLYCEQFANPRCPYKKPPGEPW